MEPEPSSPRPARRLALILTLVAVVAVAVSLFVAEAEFLHLLPASARLRMAPSSRFDCHDESPSHTNCIVPLLHLGEFTGSDTVLYDEEIFQVDWSTQVPQTAVAHLGTLHRACLTHRESVIPWNYGRTEGDPNALLLNRTDNNHTQLLTTLRQCPSFDVYIPGSLRGHGYCEDAAAYTKYGHARMLPRWVLEMEFMDVTLDRKVRYHELCPRTPLLMFNHYWDGHRTDPAWPITKPLYLMPNIEMFELDSSYYWQADVVLCKTVICADYLTQWFVQEGNPRFTRVLYTRHTTTDVAMTDSNTHKNFKDPVFVHTAGSSSQKGTARVFDCWLNRTNLPRVDIYITEESYHRLFKKEYGQRLESGDHPNIQLHVGRLEPAEFGAVIANASFFLCPSVMEGYGHYINQARAAGGFVLTPDVPPMNELVTPHSGQLIAAHRGASVHHFLGGASRLENGLHNVAGFVARLGGEELCAAVDTVLTQVDPLARAARAHRARQQYFYDTAFFAAKMQELRLTVQPQEKNTPQ